jgi:hypothetical protein
VAGVAKSAVWKTAGNTSTGVESRGIVVDASTVFDGAPLIRTVRI